MNRTKLANATLKSDGAVDRAIITNVDNCYIMYTSTYFNFCLTKDTVHRSQGTKIMRLT